MRSGEIDPETIPDKDYDKYLDANLHWSLKKSKKEPDPSAAELPAPPPFGAKALLHEFLQFFR